MNRKPILEELHVGDTVKILRQNTDDEFIEGKILNIISKFDHPDGVFVKLENNLKGRVQDLLDSKISEITNTYVVIPEDFKTEYKEHYVNSPDELDDPKSWVVPYSVFKTIAAFANGEGGKLVIGIHDSGSIPGLQRDYDAMQLLQEKHNSIFKPDQDGFELMLKNNIKTYFPNQSKFVLDLIYRIKFISIKSDVEICEIYVHPTYDNPLIMYERKFNLEKSVELFRKKTKEGNDVEVTDFKKFTPADKKIPILFVRKGNSSEQYEIEEFLEYWVRRMKSPFYRNKFEDSHD
jgi:hypothetical protein